MCSRLSYTVSYHGVILYYRFVNSISPVIYLIFIIMLTKEYKDALCLLDNLEMSTADEFPHFAVSLVLYHCRFINKALFVDLVCRFIHCGYNPLRRTDKYESILITNIYVCMS